MKIETDLKEWEHVTEILCPGCGVNLIGKDTIDEVSETTVASDLSDFYRRTKEESNNSTSVWTMFNLEPTYDHEHIPEVTRYCSNCGYDLTENNIL